MDNRLALMAGTDIPVPECKVVLHQPTITEISFVGEEDFFVGVQTLCLSKTMFIEDERVLEQVNNFQIFMTVMNDKTTADKKAAVKKVLSLVLPKYSVMLTPKTILVKDDTDSFMIDEDNFEAFQEALKMIFCAKTGPMNQQAFNPANAKAKEIADKLMRGRQRVAAQKGELNASVFSQYLSILTIGLHIPITELLQTTMFQLYDLMERYTLYINWDIDIRSRLAGGKPENQPENWMKNIHQ
jgi:hypothetical protein